MTHPGHHQRPTTIKIQYWLGDGTFRLPHHMINSFFLLLGRIKQCSNLQLLRAMPGPSLCYPCHRGANKGARRESMQTHVALMTKETLPKLLYPRSSQLHNTIGRAVTYATSWHRGFAARAYELAATVSDGSTNK